MNVLSVVKGFGIFHTHSLWNQKKSHLHVYTSSEPKRLINFHILSLWEVGSWNDTIIRGEPERARNTRETGSGVYIYLFVRDLAWQRPNVHAQSPRVRT